jgi:hypothetical protein
VQSIGALISILKRWLVWPNPKIVRAVTLMSGSLSQFLVFYLLHMRFGDPGIILLAALSILGNIANQIEFGKFAAVVAIQHNDSYSDKIKRDLIGTLYAQVLRNGFLFILVAGPSLPYFVKSLSRVEAVSIVILAVAINVSTFIIKYLIAIGSQSKFFALFSILHFIMPVVVFCLVNLQLNLVNSLQIYYLAIATIHLCLAINICIKNKLRPIFSEKPTKSHNVYSIYFFSIGLELGVLYQWDRIWVSQFMETSEAANYALMFLIYASLVSILSVDYQDFWNDSYSNTAINFKKQLLRMHWQGVLFSLVLTLAILLAFRLFDRDLDGAILSMLGLVIAIYLQSIHNFTSGLTSKSISGLKFHACIILVCIVVRFIYLFPNLPANSISLDMILISWCAPFTLIQFPATLFYAIRVRRNA